MESVRQFCLIVIVLGALAGALAVLKKRGANVKLPLFVKKNRRMEIVERLTLSQQSCLVLIRIDHREILIASSAAGCSVLEERAIAREATA